MSELKSKAVPQLYQTRMVRALMRTLNPKTETRRILDPQPPFDPEHVSVDVDDLGFITFWSGNHTQGIYHQARAKVRQGDTIWVKETFFRATNAQDQDCFIYKAGRIDEEIDGGWTSSLFMPREASRITLEVTEKVRVERLQDISEKSALAEGFIKLRSGSVVEFEGAQHFGAEWPTAKEAYRDLWNDINLTPKPLYKNKEIVGYVCYPWSHADFDTEYQGVRKSGLYRGKPIKVIENPWVTVTTFRLKELRT